MAGHAINVEHFDSDVGYILSVFISETAISKMKTEMGPILFPIATVY